MIVSEAVLLGLLQTLVLTVISLLVLLGISVIQSIVLKRKQAAFYKHAQETHEKTLNSLIENIMGNNQLNPRQSSNDIDDLLKLLNDDNDDKKTLN